MTLELSAEEQRRAEKIVRQLRLLNGPFSWGIVLLVAGSYIAWLFGWLSVGVFVLCLFWFLLLVVYRCSVSFTTKRVVTILSEEVNAPLYYQIVVKMNVATARIAAEHATGNFRFGADACTELLKSNVKRGKEDCLCYLAVVYFDLCDFAKLEQICAAFDRYVSSLSARRKEKVLASYPVMPFFSAFLRGDDAWCFDYIQRRKSDSRLTDFYLRYRAGILHTRRGELEQAKACFRDVSEAAPRFCITDLATERLALLESGEDALRVTREVLPDGGASMAAAGVSKRFLLKPQRKWICLLFTFLCVFVLSVPVIAWREYKKEQELWERQTLEAIELYYEDVELLHYATIMSGDEVIETIEICSTSDGGLIVGCTYVYSDRDDVVHFYPAGSKIQPGIEYSFIGPTSGRQIYFCFYEERDEIPADGVVYRSKITYSDQVYYFVVTLGE